MPRVDHYLLKHSLMGNEDECGDAGVIIENNQTCFLALIDGVGHGSEACSAAIVARDFLLKNYGGDLVDIMNDLHACLKGSRGAVAALCRLDIASGELQHVGVGNITVRIFGSDDRRLISKDGIIGYMITNPKEQREKMYPGEILLLSSDGIKEHFDPDVHPGLLTGSAREIASKIYAKFGKNGDDASCIVLRYDR